LAISIDAAARNGPDSAGVAVFGSARPFWVVQVKAPPDVPVANAVEALRKDAEVLRQQTTGAYLRLEVGRTIDAQQLERLLEGCLPVHCC